MGNFEALFLVGAFVFFAYKVYTVLGKTNGEEARKAAEIAAIIEKQKLEKEKSTSKSVAIEAKAEKIVEVEIIPEQFKNIVEQAKKIDATFSLNKFLSGANGAFELVIEGFAEKKKEALSFLLSPQVFESFEAEINRRETAGLEASSSVVSMTAPEVLDIELNDNICQIAVKFNSEQINFVKNKEGELVSGSKNQIDRISEVWTFERDLSSKKPNWTIIGIQD